MKILVTGGTGFLGGHLARRLLAGGHAVHLMGRGFDESRALIAAGALPAAVDLRDRPAVIAACAGMEAVFHAGALSAPWGKRADFFGVNVAGTAAVVEGCRQGRVGRLIHVSSPSVIFDGGSHIDAAEDRPYPRRFTSDYALTKKIGEDLVNASGLPAVILRPKAIFGPGDRAILPRLIAAARAGRLPQIGPGRNRVDLTYVDNVVQALVLALESGAAAGRTYTITNDEHVLLWDLIKSILRRLGLADRLHPIATPLMLAAAALMEARAALTGREPLLTRYSVAILARTQTYDISAARRDLGYRPIVSVAEGVERTLAALTAGPPQ
jgi:nucleoside-diphosphate-sugar epimerase